MTHQPLNQKETTAKMSSGWAPVEPIRPRQRMRPKPGAILTGVRPPRCPACGKPILYDVDDPGKIKAHCQHCRIVAQEEQRDRTDWSIRSVGPPCASPAPAPVT